MVVQLVSVEQDGVVRLALNGPVTAQQIEQDDHHPLVEALGHEWYNTRVVLDMSAADYIDSTAVGWLLSCQKQFSRGGGSMVLHSVTPQVREIFDILRIDRMFALAEDETHAVKIARGEQP